MAGACLNNYDKSSYVTEFASTDESLKKCNKCPNMSYEDGIATCNLFTENEVVDHESDAN